MKWPKFEQLINKRLSKRQAEVDIDALWAALEPEVDAINRSKRRGIGWWWLSIGSGLLVAGLTAWLWWGVATQPRVEALPILLEGTEYAGLAAGGAEERSGSADGGAHAKARRAQENRAVVGEIHAEVQGARSGSKKATKAHATSQRAQKGQQQKTEEHVGLQETAQSASFLPEETIPAILPRTPLPAVSTSADKAIAAISISVASQAAGKAYFPEDSTAAATPLIKPKRKFRFSVALQGGAGATQLKRSARSDFDESNTLLELRNQRETLLEHTQAGLFFDLRHNSGLQLSTGLHYTQINERYDYQRSESITIDSVYGPQLLVTNLYDEIDTLYGTVPVEEVNTYTKRYYNRHRLLEIPILLGYQHSVAPRLRLGMQAGVFLNISMRSKGRIARLPDTDIAVNEAQAYRSRLGWSYYLGLLVDYQLSPRIHAYAAPSMRYFPESFTRPDYPLEQAYRLYTVNIGVRYRW